jgi:predicted metal-dependent enzyme (double-stranded beta helix superfamily)
MEGEGGAVGHMPAPYVLSDFLNDVEAVVRSENDQRKIVDAIEPLMKRLVSSDDLSWIKQEYRSPPVSKSGPAAGYGQYCLYRRGQALSVIAFCWGAGKGTPVHDHLSWGVLGFIDGQEKETRYRRVDDGSDSNHAKLQEVGVVYTRKGETSHLLTPSRDIHRVENPGDRPSLSIHVYGCDMGVQRRRRYDPATGAIEWYTTPHDSDEIVIPEAAPAQRLAGYGSGKGL